MANRAVAIYVVVLMSHFSFQGQLAYLEIRAVRRAADGEAKVLVTDARRCYLEEVGISVLVLHHRVAGLGVQHGPVGLVVGTFHFPVLRIAAFVFSIVVAGSELVAFQKAF